MTDRLKIDTLLRDFYSARMRGDLDTLCKLFSKSATFQISGASNVSPIMVTSTGVDQFRPLLALMIKSFKLSDHTILSTIIDGAKAAVHWRVNVHSKITGTTIPTELVDILEIQDGRVASYVEFFAPLKK